MFIYDRAEAPGYTHSLIGRLFGQYGTYSAGFRANLYRGLKNGTKAQRMAFAARWIGNMSAIAAGMHAIGISPGNFIPWTPALFQGGPLFDLAMTALRSTGQGYEAQQARTELVRSISPIRWDKLDDVGQMDSVLELLNLPQSYTPFYHQIRGIKRFIDYSDRGDHWLAWLSLTTAPIRPDLRQ
jgi:hypothetical protein